MTHADNGTAKGAGHRRVWHHSRPGYGAVDLFNDGSLAEPNLGNVAPSDAAR